MISSVLTHNASSFNEPSHLWNHRQKSMSSPLISKTIAGQDAQRQPCRERHLNDAFKSWRTLETLRDSDDVTIFRNVWKSVFYYCSKNADVHAISTPTVSCISCAEVVIISFMVDSNIHISWMLAIAMLFAFYSKPLESLIRLPVLAKDLSIFIPFSRGLTESYVLKTCWCLISREWWEWGFMIYNKFNP